MPRFAIYVHPRFDRHPGFLATGATPSKYRLVGDSRKALTFATSAEAAALITRLGYVNRTGVAEGRASAYVCEAMSSAEV